MSLALTPALRDAIERWGAHSLALDGASAHTIRAYRADVVAFADFLSLHTGAAATPERLEKAGQSDMRAFMAHERGRGLGTRSLARRLSSIKSFIRWLTDRSGAEATAVLAARAPKYRRKLPHPFDGLPSDHQIGVPHLEIARLAPQMFQQPPIQRPQPPP